ncbi:MAG: hypothetical protein WAZ34_15440 [Rhodocyclaceae bacterium]
MNPSFLQTLFVGVALTIAGCASTTPNLDARFGQAVLAARAQQTINPDASLNADPVSGLDGRAAREAMGRYHDSFKTPPPSFSVINIGGSIAGGQ